jgi:hypothetical protein
VARPCDDGEDTDDVALGEQRYEGGSSPRRRRERTVDTRRRDRVVDRDGHTLADDGHDRAAVRVSERDAPPPLVDAARDEPDRGPQLLVDLGEQERVRLEQRVDLVEQRSGRLSAVCACESADESREIASASRPRSVAISSARAPGGAR